MMRLRLQILGLSAAVLCGLTCPEFAAAQSSSMFGASGPLGQSSSQRGTSLSSAGGALGGSAGGMGMGGRGGGGGNNRGLLGNAGIAGSGAQLGQGGFIGATNNNGAVVGVSANGQAGQGANGAGRQQSTFGGGQRLNGGNASALNRQGGALNQNGDQPAPRPGAMRPAVKPRLRIAFDYPVATRTGTIVEQRLTGLNRRVIIDGLQVVVAAGTVTLQGTVNTENDRKVAEALARLEPGVRNVQNLLIVRDGPKPDDVDE